MSETNQKNNQITIIGVMESNLVYSHTNYGEPFYDFTVKVMRHSGDYDVLPVRVSGYLMDPEKDYIGRMIFVEGELRSKTYRKDGQKAQLNLSLFAMNVELDVDDDTKINNVVELDGFICKQPNPRETRAQKISITDVFIAVNRRCRQSDYIPTIAWGRYARLAGTLPVGTRIHLIGRLQNRYISKTNSMAYEVSISKITDVEKPETKEVVNNNGEEICYGSN